MYSLRNLLTRTGIDLDLYYWVREGTADYSIPEVRDNSTRYKFESLGLQDLKAMSSLRMRSNKGEIINGIKNGQKCIALKDGDNVAAFMCIEYNDFTINDKKFKLESDEAYLLNMYTMNNYRGQNLAPFLRHKSYELLKAEGRKNIYSITEYFNNSSRKFKEKLNAENMSLYFCIGLFKKKYWTFKLKDIQKK
ncbi:GNAT family N-acetyltransferase [Flagellimonas onchidii]|uniref:GNAT family N-acetyltransferase n=1 Tax=Flagellimonas onchidii TaxID=2562684 RepID=UPI0010A6A352|nr:GNAT family N-acetyltransferase [Allomuricauda onchidii]